MDVSTEVIEQWAEVFRPTIADAQHPDSEAAIIDGALSRDGNPSRRLGMWLALLDRRSPAEQHEALSGISRVLAEVSSIKTQTAVMLFGRMAADDLWLQPYAVEPCLRITSRIAQLNVDTRREVVTYALRTVARFPHRHEAVGAVGTFATLDDRTMHRIAAELPPIDGERRRVLLNIIEERLRAERPEMFVAYVEGLMTWWDSFDEAAREELAERLVPILNTEILRDFTQISALAFERTTNAIANAPQMDEELRRSLIRELVPHSRDLAARQPISPPLVARLESGDESVIDRVLENARDLDPLAAAGFLLNVIELLKTSALRFPFAERLIAAYGEYDIVRRAATIDILGREMWRFLGGYAEATAIEVEGLAEASEPFINVLEIELVEQLRTEIDALRLLSFPRV